MTDHCYENAGSTSTSNTTNAGFPACEANELIEQVELRCADPSANEAAESLATESMDGYNALVSAQRARTESLKNGERSGVTGPLGKLEFVDSSASQTATNSTVPDAEAAKSSENPVELARAADSIHAALDGWNDAETVFAVLKDKTEAERTTIGESFHKKYGKSLEDYLKDQLSGAERDKALNILHRKDGRADRAGRIHTAIMEHAQWVEGRSEESCEKDIRDTLATMSSEQIEHLENEYRERYGFELRDALLKGDLSDATKTALGIYLKGSDQRTDDDRLALADVALEAESLEMFQEAMRDSSDEVRKRFMENNGEERLKDAFEGHWYNAGKYVGIQLVFFAATDTVGSVTDSDLDNALEHAKHGKLSTEGKLKSNQSWFGDNEDAIEQALKEMSPEERKSYLGGRKLEEKLPPDIKEATSDMSAEELDEYLSRSDKLSAQDKRDLSTYRRLRAQLDDAGNDTEIAKWEDQIAEKGGTLISKALSHRGSIYDDGAHDILSTIEDMSKSDWKRLKNDSDYRNQLEAALKTYVSDDEFNRCKALLDEKVKATTFEKSRAQRRDVKEAISDNAHWHDNNEENIVEQLTRMTVAEQEEYRSNERFRKELDAKLQEVLDEGAELDAAKAILARVAKGEKPTQDIVSKLNMHASDTNTDEAKVVRDIQIAFKDDPTLHARLKNPSSEEDKLLAKQFDEALRRALDHGDNDDEYEKYAQPLLENGYLSIEKQMELNTGIDDDEQGAYKDVVALAQSTHSEAMKEREQLLNDVEFQAKVFQNLNKEERAIAMNALRQGKMMPEDVVRSHMVGAGTGEEEVKEVLRGLTPEQIEQLKKDYALKYGEDLNAAILDELGSQDAIDAMRLAKRPPNSIEEAFDDARDEYYNSRDGIGSAWVDGSWDGTGYMSDEALNNYARAMTDVSRGLKTLTPDEQKELIDALQKNLDMHRESKGAAADIVVDAVIIAASIAGAKFTGGLSLTLISLTALGGAAFKVLTKSALMGADYDWASTQVLMDAITGAIDAASAVAGPSQLAVTLKVGEKAAMSAAGIVVKEAGEQAAKQAGKALTREAVAEGIEQGSKSILKEGAKELLEKRLKNAVAHAIANGDKEIDKRAIKEIAKQVADEGQEEAVEALIKKGLQESFEQEAKSALKRTSMELGLDMASGAMADGMSGTVDGFSQWDSAKSFEQNMASVGQAIAASIAVGAAAGFGGNMGFKAGGAVLSLGKSATDGIRQHFKVKSGERLSGGHLEEVAKASGLPDAKAHEDANGNIVIETPTKPGNNDSAAPASNGPNDSHPSGDSAPASQKTDADAPPAEEPHYSDDADNKLTAITTVDREGRVIETQVPNEEKPIADDLPDIFNPSFADDPPPAHPHSTKEKLKTTGEASPRDLESAESEYIQAMQRYKSEVVEKTDGISAQDLTSDEAMRRHLVNDPEKSQLLENYIAARERFNEVRRKENAVETNSPAPEAAQSHQEISPQESAMEATPEKAVAGFRSGEVVQVNGQDYEVLGKSGDLVYLRSPGEPAPDGRPKKVSDDDLEKRYVKVPDSDFYTDKKQPVPNIYKLATDEHGQKTLLEYWDAVATEPEHIARKPADAHSSPSTRDIRPDAVSPELHAAVTRAELVAELKDFRFTDESGRKHNLYDAILECPTLNTEERQALFHYLEETMLMRNELNAMRPNSAKRHNEDWQDILLAISERLDDTSTLIDDINSPTTPEVPSIHPDAKVHEIDPVYLYELARYSGDPEFQRDVRMTSMWLEKALPGSLTPADRAKVTRLAAKIALVNAGADVKFTEAERALLAQVGVAA